MSKTTKQKAMSGTAAVSLPDPEQPTAVQSGTVWRVQAVATAPAHSIPQALDYGDVAEILGVTVRHVQVVVAAGKLRPIPDLGRLVRFAPGEVLRFMNATPEAASA
jgi:Helix-turn-helix domain